MPHWTGAYITVDDFEFHFTRTGNGSKPPLLLLHGFSDNGLCWLPVARELEAQYDVIMPDARGHGLSPRIQSGQAIDNAADAAGLISALGLHRTLVCGHSMGGQTATELGAHYPDLVGGFILEDPAWIDLAPNDRHRQEDPFFAWLLDIETASLDNIIAQGKASNPAWQDVEFSAWAESKQQLDKNVFRAANVRRPWRECLSALAVPALLLTADVARGAIVTPEMAQEAVSRAPGLQVTHISGAGHNVRRENYPAFMNAVEAFLSQLHT